MAVDTRNKRFSLIGFGETKGSPIVYPNPDGTVDNFDRAQFIYLYAGITLSGTPVAPVNPDDIFFLRRRRME